jgi:hypothetical protein
MPVWGFMKRLKVRLGETPKPTPETSALPIHVFAQISAPASLN